MFLNSLNKESNLFSKNSKLHQKSSLPNYFEREFSLAESVELNIKTKNEKYHNFKKIKRNTLSNSLSIQSKIKSGSFDAKKSEIKPKKKLSELRRLNNSLDLDYNKKKLEENVMNLSLQYSREFSLLNSYQKRKNSSKILNPIKSRFYLISNQLSLAKKFIHKLREAIGKRKPELLTKTITKIIGFLLFNIKFELFLFFIKFSILKRDKSFFFENFQKNLKDDIFIKKFQRKKTLIYIKNIQNNELFITFKKCFQKLCQVHDPCKNLITVWNILTGTIFLLLFFIIPFNLSFETNIFDNKFFQTPLIIFFVLNIFTKLNTGFFEKGNLIFSRKQIIKHYVLSYNFYTDIIVLFLVPK